MYCKSIPELTNPRNLGGERGFLQVVNNRQ